MHDIKTLTWIDLSIFTIGTLVNKITFDMTNGFRAFRLNYIF